ncbi:MAG: hypothetical protein LAT63_00875 [Marinobacter sp.]|nr:hypothetical protein [Marinobacter sp.]
MTPPANRSDTPLTDSRNALLQLVYIRMAVLLCLCVAILAGASLFYVEIRLLGPGITLLTLMALTVLAYGRLYLQAPVLAAEFFAHLLADALLYSVFLFLAGGAQNPFAFLLLIPLIVAATTLTWGYTLLLAVVVAGLYTSLLFLYIPLLALAEAHRHSLVSYLDLQASGLWLNFMLTVVIITAFVIPMRRALAERERELYALREQGLRDQQLLSLATAAASTAHELGTPLNTLQLVLDDLQPGDTLTTEDLQLLKEQTTLCATRLQQIRERARRDPDCLQPLTQLVDEVLDEWRFMRPSARWQLQSKDAHDALPVPAGLGVRQALINLLNNAADASTEPLDIHVIWDQQQGRIRIHDQGPGLSGEQQRQLGKPFFSTKDSLGIGYFLSQTALQAHGADVQLRARDGGGTVTEILFQPGNIPAAQGASHD